MYILVTIKDQTDIKIDSIGEESIEMQVNLETDDLNTAIIQIEGAFAKFRKDTFPTTIVEAELFTDGGDSIMKKSNKREAMRMFKDMSKAEIEKMILIRFKGE